MADLELMLSRLVRGCIALAVTACVLGVARSHCLADTVKVGCELICMALAMEREPTGCSSLLMVLGTAVAGLDPMLVRLVCGCIALAVTALVLAVVCRHRLVDTVKGGELSCMALAMEREHIVHSSLLMVAGTVLTNLEQILFRLVRAFSALAFTACVLAIACSHRLADTVKGREISCMALAIEREPISCRSLVMLARTALADPKRMLARLVRGFIAVAFTACVLAVACSHRLADTVKVGCELTAAWHWRWNASTSCTARY